MSENYPIPKVSDSEMTHTLSGCHTGTVVHQSEGKDGPEDLEALLSLVSSAKLNAQQDEEGCCSCLLFGTACRQQEVTV